MDYAAMYTQICVRPKNRKKYLECVRLRKGGLSYSEIRKVVSVGKSTLHDWLKLSRLTLTSEHLQIQIKKAKENHILGTAASKIIRARRSKEEVEKFIEKYQRYLYDPLFITGITLYEAEGAKESACRFSNSDYRLIKIFMNFLIKFFPLSLENNISYRLYIHTTREKDLERIKKFWSEKLSIPVDNIAVSWKRNKVAHRRENQDYVGQFSLTVKKFPIFTRKLLALSDIILDRHCGVV